MCRPVPPYQAFQGTAPLETKQRGAELHARLVWATESFGYEAQGGRATSLLVCTIGGVNMDALQLEGNFGD